MKTTYKTPLPTSGMIVYLENNKRVTFNNISKADAEKILYEHCYINVITPYKHCFARIDPSSGLPARDANNCHIYDKDTDFSEYIKKYEAERNLYPTIFKNIMAFESTFNSIVSYEVLNAYHIDSYAKFINFCNTLSTNVLSMKVKDSVREHLLDEISGFYSKMKRYEDIYIFLDRLSLSGIITVYRTCPKRIKNKIFQGLLAANMTFGYSSPGTFEDLLIRIIPIRNCICHSNSLEILINYYDIKKKDLRNSTDRTRYISVIKKLSI